MNNKMYPFNCIRLTFLCVFQGSEVSPQPPEESERRRRQHSRREPSSSSWRGNRGTSRALFTQGSRMRARRGPLTCSLESFRYQPQPKRRRLQLSLSRAPDPTAKVQRRRARKAKMWFTRSWNGWKGAWRRRRGRRLQTRWTWRRFARGEACTEVSWRGEAPLATWRKGWKVNMLRLNLKIRAMCINRSYICVKFEYTFRPSSLQCMFTFCLFWQLLVLCSFCFYIHVFFKDFNRLFVPEDILFTLEWLKRTIRILNDEELSQFPLF